MKYLAALTLLVLGASCDDGAHTEALAPPMWKTAAQYDDSDHDPTLHQGGFFVADERRLDAYDAATGTLRWSQPITVGSTRTFADNGRVFTAGYSIHAFDATTGAALWTHRSTTDTTIYTRGAAGGGRVFVGSVKSGAVIALDAATGRQLWRSVFQRDGWPWPGGVAGLQLHEGVLYAVGERPYASNGYIQALIIAAFDPATGAELWRYQEGDQRTAYLSNGTLSFHGDLILFSDAPMRQVIAVDRRTRTRRWLYQLPLDWAGPGQAPDVVDGVAYFGSGDGRVYALDAATGALVWKGTTEGSSHVTHAVCGPYLIASFLTATVYRKSDGKELGPLFGGDARRSRSRIVVDGSRMYFSASDGAYAYDCST